VWNLVSDFKEGIQIKDISENGVEEDTWAPDGESNGTLVCIERSLIIGTFQMLFFFYWRYNPLWVCILQSFSGALASSRTRFLDHTQRRATFGRPPLDE